MSTALVRTAASRARAGFGPAQSQPRRSSRVVIVGGGAGGLELAIRLAKLTRPGDRARVTLIDRRLTHIWKPRLHEIAAGLLVAAQEEAGYAAQGRRHGFDFVLGEVTRLDPEHRRIEIGPTSYPADDPVAHATGDDLLSSRTLDYDTAVLAIGSTVNDFGVPGVREHCYTLDSPVEAERLHHALLARAARVKAGVQAELRVVIVGAGTTGVELAAELRNAAGRLSQYRSLLKPGQLGITLLEAAERALPASPPSISTYARHMLAAHDVEMRFEAKVVSVAPDAVGLDGGEVVPADLVVWASGVRAQQLARPLADARYGKNGRLALDPQLRVLRADGRPYDELYGLGDCAAAPLASGGSVGATAQAAHQQAALLARSLARRTRGRAPLAFHYRYRGSLVSLGEGAAVGDVPAPNGGDLRVSGLGAKLAYAGLYEAHLVELFGVWRTAALALSGALRRSAQPTIKLYW